MSATAAAERFGVDAFLGGRVEAVQPLAGHHRSGLDAVLLAAAIGDDAAGRAVDLGAGAGVSGLCLAARAARVGVVLAEREAELVDCARAALRRPANVAFSARVEAIEADIASESGRRAAGLAAASFDIALMNPPFHDAGSVRVSPDGSRARAHVLGEEGLDAWFRAAAALLKPGGTLAAILPAARLADLLGAMEGRFGATAVLPVHPRAGEAAIRVVARGVKGSRAPLRLMPPLVLHGEAGGAYLPGPAAILRDGAALCEVHPWLPQ